MHCVCLFSKSRGLHKHEFEIGLIYYVCFYVFDTWCYYLKKKKLRKLTGTKFYIRFGDVLLYFSNEKRTLFSWRQCIKNFNYLIHDYRTCLVSINNLFVWYTSMIQSTFFMIFLQMISHTKSYRLFFFVFHTGKAKQNPCSQVHVLKL